MREVTVPKPREITAQAPGVAGPPLSEGPVSGKDLVLRSMTERCVARLKSRHLEAAYQGPKCSADAAMAHTIDRGRDPEAETKAISLELLPLKFDITREAYGTEDAYVVIKSGEPLSFFALHGLMLKGGENAGISTLALRLPAELLPGIIAELKEDPRFVNDILHSVLPAAPELSFSIKTRIDVIYDRSYFVFRLDESPPIGGQTQG